MIPGSHIGQYRIVEKLGAGGMGTVYLAEHVLLGRRAAIKTLMPAVATQRQVVDRFFTEARATSAIADPGVVQVFDFGYHVDGTAFIVMELLEGEALSERMDRHGPLPQGDALKIARQIASALGAAHRRGIVHRDLKPENIYLVRDTEAQGGERTKLLDFGICKLAGGRASTENGTTLGTPVYMAPEQCRGTTPVDQRTDVYALGCVLFQMLTGRTVFQCSSASDYLLAHINDDPPVATALVPELHPLIDVLLRRCLAKDPEDRFQTMADFRDALGDVMSLLGAPGLARVLAPASPVLGAGFRSGMMPIGTPPPPAESSPSIELVARRTPSGPMRVAISTLAVGAAIAAVLVGRGTLLDSRNETPVVSPTAALPVEAPPAVIAYETVPPRPAEPPRAPDAATWSRVGARLAGGTIAAAMQQRSPTPTVSTVPASVSLATPSASAPSAPGATPRVAPQRMNATATAKTTPAPAKAPVAAKPAPARPKVVVRAKPAAVADRSGAAAKPPVKKVPPPVEQPPEDLYDAR